MLLCGIVFELKEIDGKFCLQPKEKLDVKKFQEVLKIVKAHGGMYSRMNGFVFTEKPEFSAPEPEQEEKVEMPVIPNVVSHEEVEIKKAIKELDKPENKVKEEDIPKGKEVEVLVDKGVESCVKHFEDLMAEEEYKSKDHQVMLDMLKERCYEDEEFRKNCLTKEYQKMLSNGALAWYRSKKMSGGSCVCSPEDIVDFVVESYKEKKKVTTTTKTKKTTKKK